jgi:hypothetical protein
MGQIGSLNGNPVYEGELPDDLDMSHPWYLVPADHPVTIRSHPAEQGWPDSWIEIGVTEEVASFPTNGRHEPFWPDAYRPQYVAPVLGKCPPACILMGESKRDD